MLKVKIKEVSLNLIYDYPVYWSKYKVLRDFIQNFYDSVPNHEFHQRFNFNLEDDKLIMSVKNIGFNYEWLMHIGASTKRESEKKHAGYFGEGFKIASLCALRDHKWGISIESKDWFLEVTTENIHIENKTMMTLAYDIYERNNDNNDTILEINNFFEADIEIFYAALYTFYYKQNPLFAECLFENENVAVFRRSKMEKPRGYPSISKDDGEGITFGAFQALGSLKTPLIFCDHTYRLSDRDRNTFTKIDTINILVSVASNLPCEISRILLEEFESYWYSYPKEKYGHDSYYAFIRKLIIRVSFSGLQTELFKKNNPNLLVANKLLGSNVHKHNLRKFALIWLKKEENRYKLVQDSFERLGYKSIEKACEDAGGYSNVKEPSVIERNYIKVLEKLTIDLFKDFFMLDTFPKYAIITNDTCVLEGIAECYTQKKLIKNEFNYVVKKDIKKVQLHKDLFNNNSFHSALSTYLHELCHMFGGDKSARFSLVLTKAIEILIANNHKINKYKKNWVAVGLKHDK